MDYLEKIITIDALEKAIVYFKWQIEQFEKLWNLDEMLEDEARLHLIKIDNYKQRQKALENLLKSFKE